MNVFKKTMLSKSLLLIGLILLPWVAQSYPYDDQSNFSEERQSVSIPDFKEFSNLMNNDDHKEKNAGELLIARGREMIKTGGDMVNARDDRSSFDGRYIDRTSTRLDGRQQIQRGEQMVRQGSEKLRALYSRLQSRREGLDQIEAEGKFRNWKNREGAVIRAAYQEVRGSVVILLREDGFEFEVPMDTLSDEDVAYAHIRNAGFSVNDYGFLEAIRKRNLETIKHFFTANFKPYGNTVGDAVCETIRQGDMPIFRYLLDKGLSPTDPDKDGNRPLSIAVRDGKNEFVLALLDLKASPLQSDRNAQALSPLHWALLEGNQAALDLILGKKPPLSHQMLRAVELIQGGTMGSISMGALQAIAKLEKGEKLDSKSSAEIELLLAGLSATEDGFLNAIKQPKNKEHLVHYNTLGITLSVIKNSWQRLESIFYGNPHIPYEPILLAEGISPEQSARIKLLATQHPLTTEGFIQAVKTSNIEVATTYLNAGHKILDKDSGGKTVLHHVFEQENEAIEKAILALAKLKPSEIARIRLEAVGVKMPDDEKSRLELAARSKEFTENELISAIHANDTGLIDLLIQAGAAEQFSLKTNIDFWRKIWGQANSEINTKLLSVAEFTDKERILVKANVLLKGKMNVVISDRKTVERESATEQHNDRAMPPVNVGNAQDTEKEELERCISSARNTVSKYGLNLTSYVKNLDSNIAYGMRLGLGVSMARFGAVIAGDMAATSVLGYKDLALYINNNMGLSLRNLTMEEVSVYTMEDIARFEKNTKASAAIESFVSRVLDENDPEAAASVKAQMDELKKLENSAVTQQDFARIDSLSLEIGQKLGLSPGQLMEMGFGSSTLTAEQQAARAQRAFNSGQAQSEKIFKENIDIILQGSGNARNMDQDQIDKAKDMALSIMTDLGGETTSKALDALMKGDSVAFLKAIDGSKLHANEKKKFDSIKDLDPKAMKRVAEGVAIAHVTRVSVKNKSANYVSLEERQKSLIAAGKQAVYYIDLETLIRGDQ